jgi:hypothetical protein
MESVKIKSAAPMMESLRLGTVDAPEVVPLLRVFLDLL